MIYIIKEDYGPWKKNSFMVTEGAVKTGEVHCYDPALDPNVSSCWPTCPLDKLEPIEIKSGDQVELYNVKPNYIGSILIDIEDKKGELFTLKNIDFDTIYFTVSHPKIKSSRLFAAPRFKLPSPIKSIDCTCTCDIIDLMTRGCKCGALKK